MQECTTLGILTLESISAGSEGLQREVCSLQDSAVKTSAMELVAIWVDPELEELSEVACCLLNFFVQFCLSQDRLSGIDQGTKP